MKSCIFLLALFLIQGASQDALASCGAATCPLNNHRYLKAGWLRLGVIHEYINQDQIYVGSSRSFAGALPSHHDEVQTLNERNIFLFQFGILDALGLNIELPFIHREHNHIGHENGQNIWESWNFSGLGDMIVSTQYALLRPSEEFEPYVSLLVGVRIPTGVTGMKNAEGEEAEVTIQPGTGSLDGIIGINYRQTLLSVPTVSGKYSALPLSVGVSYQANGKGTYDYRFGNSLLASVGTAYQFIDRASLLFQVNGRFQGFADVGTTGEFRDNTGGTWIFVSPGLSTQLSDVFSAQAYIQVPLYQDVHGIQQTARFNLQFGLSANVDLLR